MFRNRCVALSERVSLSGLQLPLLQIEELQAISLSKPRLVVMGANSSFTRAPPGLQQWSYPDVLITGSARWPSPSGTAPAANTASRCLAATPALQSYPLSPPHKAQILVQSIWASFLQQAREEGWECVLFGAQDIFLFRPQLERLIGADRGGLCVSHSPDPQY